MSLWNNIVRSNVMLKWIIPHIAGHCGAMDYVPWDTRNYNEIHLIMRQCEFMDSKNKRDVPKPSTLFNDKLSDEITIDINLKLIYRTNY